MTMCKLYLYMFLILGYVSLGINYMSYFLGYKVEWVPSIVTILFFLMVLMLCKIETMPEPEGSIL